MEDFQTNLLERYSNPNDKIVLVEDGRILHDDTMIGGSFNSYFVNIIDTLGLRKETISAHEDVIFRRSNTASDIKVPAPS